LSFLPGCAADSFVKDVQRAGFLALPAEPLPHAFGGFVDDLDLDTIGKEPFGEQCEVDCLGAVEAGLLGNVAGDAVDQLAVVKPSCGADVAVDGVPRRLLFRGDRLGACAFAPSVNAIRVAFCCFGWCGLLLGLLGKRFP
jgi:hypothetical protein